MEHFDHDFLADVMGRLGRIKPEDRPCWGTLTPAGMVAHLVDVVRYSMGKTGEIPNRSSWFSRRVLAPLVLNGMIAIPKNIRTPGFDCGKNSQADLETLHAVLEDYLALVQAGELEPRPHPFLGDIGVDGWDRLHVLHFRHHLRQFNA